MHHSYKFQPSTLPAKVEGQGAYAYRGEYNETSILSENTLTYNKDFDKRHHFDAGRLHGADVGIEQHDYGR